MEDLNSQIAGFAFTADNRAAAARREAARLLAIPKSGWPDLDSNNRRNADAAEQLAAKWDATAAIAREGFVRVDSSDIPLQMEFRDLIGAAAAASRVKHVDPDAVSEDPLAISQPLERVDPNPLT